MPALHRRNLPSRRPMVDGGMRKCSAVEDYARRGLVPRWGWDGAWQSAPCQFAVPSHNSGFSYLAVPPAAGMNDCYESMSRTTIRDRLPPLISSFQRSKACPVPRYGAGIQKGRGVRPPDDRKNRPGTPFSSSSTAFAGHSDSCLSRIPHWLLNRSAWTRAVSRSVRSQAPGHPVAQCDRP